MKILKIILKNRRKRKCNQNKTSHKLTNPYLHIVACIVHGVLHSFSGSLGQQHKKPSKIQILLENYVPAYIGSFLLYKKSKKAQKKEYLSELVLVLVLLISPGK